MLMTLTLGFSPCPNDTFIFDALVNKKIDTGGITFEVVMEDVETLNRFAFEEKLDLTKLSFPAFFRNLDSYILLNSGAALGEGVGPLLVGKNSATADILETSGLRHLTVALPGKNTTANLLFSFAYPDASEKRFMVFSAIENAVLNCETDLGVIIHENRFTYMKKGLHKIKDLGAYWEEKMKLPIPLGGIAVRRNMDQSLAEKIGTLIKESVKNAFSNYPLITDYVKEHSQTMEEEVMKQHIDLYVNDYSVELGEKGKEAIRGMYDVYKRLYPEFSPSYEKEMFLEIKSQN